MEPIPVSEDFMLSVQLRRLRRLQHHTNDFWFSRQNRLLDIWYN